LAGAPDPLDLTVEAGFTPTTHEFLQVHRHAHLDVFVNGKPVTVPPGIGIDITDPGVKTTPSDAGDTYGGIEECDDPCISPAAHPRLHGGPPHRVHGVAAERVG
jgi:hypothetical protein